MADINSGTARYNDLMNGVVVDTTERVETIKWRTKRAVDMLQACKVKLDVLVYKSISDIQNQEDYEHVQSVHDLKRPVVLSTWVETLHWSTSVRTMQANWTVQALLPAAWCSFEAATAIGRAITELKPLNHITTTPNSLNTVGVRLNNTNDAENYLLKTIERVVSNELYESEEAINTFMHHFNDLKRRTPGSVLRDFRSGDKRTRMKIVRTQWDTAFATTEDNRETSTFRERIATLMALIQLQLWFELVEIQKSLRPALRFMKVEILGPKPQVQFNNLTTLAQPIGLGKGPVQLMSVKDVAKSKKDDETPGRLQFTQPDKNGNPKKAKRRKFDHNVTPSKLTPAEAKEAMLSFSDTARDLTPATIVAIQSAAAMTDKHGRVPDAKLIMDAHEFGKRNELPPTEFPEYILWADPVDEASDQAAPFETRKPQHNDDAITEVPSTNWDDMTLLLRYVLERYIEAGEGIE